MKYNLTCASNMIGDVSATVSACMLASSCHASLDYWQICIVVLCKHAHVVHNTPVMRWLNIHLLLTAVLCLPAERCQGCTVDCRSFEPDAEVFESLVFNLVIRFLHSLLMFLLLHLTNKALDIRKVLSYQQLALPTFAMCMSAQMSA